MADDKRCRHGASFFGKKLGLILCWMVSYDLKNRVSCEWALRSVYMNRDFQCRMQQPHPTLPKKLGLILFFVRCRMWLSHPTLKIMFM
jgi:hypothetical protein